MDVPLIDSGRVAFEVQRRLLVEPPSLERADIAVSWRPFGDVGGDFYDFTGLEEGSVGITLGDVSGKGYDAALLMVFALAETRVRLRDHQRLTYLMSELDRSLRQYSSESKYAEVLVGTYSPYTRRFTYVPGGAIAPVVYRASSDELTVYESTGCRVPGISIVAGEDAPFVDQSVDLELGDVLMLFTDGVSERQDEHGELLVHRDDFGALVAPVVEKQCRASSALGASGLMKQLLKCLDDLPSGRADDETIVVLKAK